MFTNSLFNSILDTLPVLLIKLFSVAFLLLHLAFSFVLIRQTKLMIKVLEAKISSTIYSISMIHFLFSLFVLAWAILFL